MFTDRPSSFGDTLVTCAITPDRRGLRVILTGLVSPVNEYVPCTVSFNLHSRNKGTRVATQVNSIGPGQMRPFS